MSLTTNRFIRSHETSDAGSLGLTDAVQAHSPGKARLISTAHLDIRQSEAYLAKLCSARSGGAVSRMVLLVIDCDGEWPAGSAAHRLIGSRIAAALASARSLEMSVVYTHNNSLPAGAPGTMYAPSIAPHEDEPDFPKTALSPFSEPQFEQYLAERSIETLVVIGFGLRLGVYQTCLDALERGYHIVVLRDCTL